MIGHRCGAQEAELATQVSWPDNQGVTAEVNAVSIICSCANQKIADLDGTPSRHEAAGDLLSPDDQIVLQSPCDGNPAPTILGTSINLKFLSPRPFDGLRIDRAVARAGAQLFLTINTLRKLGYRPFNGDPIRGAGKDRAFNAFNCRIYKNSLG